MSKPAKKEKQALAAVGENTTAVSTSIKLGAFKVKKMVTLPTFKLAVGIPLIVRADAPMYVGKKLKGQENDTGREPATILPCSRLNDETGEVEMQGQIVLGAVLKDNLAEQYADGSYVGKTFAILKGEKREGKRYNDYQIMEIEVA